MKNIKQFEITQYIRRKIVLNTLGITYQEFLKSHKWKEAREKLFKKDGKKCKICTSTKRINVHHNRYNDKNLTGSIQCLIVLCEECHGEVHRISKIRGWAYKRSVNSLEKRFKKYGSIYHYPEKSAVIDFKV